MTEGNGPGRGTPWWRIGRLLFGRYEPGVGEKPGAKRPGRTVAKIKKDGDKK